MWSLTDCKILEFPIVADHRGNLTFVEANRHIPFEFKRLYYLYDVPGGAERAAHAHRTLHQVYIAMSGSFDVHLDDGQKQRSFHLNRSYYGLYICPMIWRSVDNFSSNAVLSVLASDYYDEADYIRDHADFHNIVAPKP